MGKVNYHVTQNSVTVNFEGKTLAISRGDARFPKVINAIKAGELDTIPEIVDISASFAKDGFKLVDGQVVTPSGEALPAELNARIVEFQREGLPFTHLLTFWENLKQNPSYRSREQLFKFLEHNGHPLTEDGCFVAYRGVTEDFKDKHTRKFDNSPGSICEMPRDQVDDDPTRTCSAGLHAAAWGYASDWSGTRVEVKINPRDVVAVPVDYNGEKMRVCRFEVIQVCEKPLENQSLYGVENKYSAEQEDTEPFDDVDEEFDPCEDEGTIEDVLMLADEHSQYDGDALIQRISEDSYEDDDTIRKILEKAGRI